MPDALPPFLILAVTSTGFAIYFTIAQKRKTSRVEEFFLSGRNIGLPLFTQTSWGSSFAFGNSIFYAAWLGYTVGLSSLWIQALWAVGMCCYAFLLPRLVQYTENHTLHGFLGSMYGGWCRVIASAVSAIGLIVLLGFEVSFAAQYFAQVTNLKHFEWLVVIGGATFMASFCSVGGFKANVRTDRLSNYLAVGALLFLLAIMVYRYHSQLAIGFSCSAIWDSATRFPSSNGKYYIAGLAVFGLFNMVDTSNWQNVSANSLGVGHTQDGQQQRRRMRRAMLKAAGLFLFAPVLTGTTLGYMLRVLKQGTEDQTAFMSQIVLNLLPPDSPFSAIFLALVTFIFMASSLSGTDSWLLASAQTISWDLVDFKKFKEKGFSVGNFEQSLHDEVTRRARWILLCVGVGGTCLVYAISLFWRDVFSLQFVIFGGGLAMLPSLLYAILTRTPSKSSVQSFFAVASIGVGYGSALALFFYSLYMKRPEIVNPLPLVALGVATLLFVTGFFLRQVVDYFANQAPAK